MDRLPFIPDHLVAAMEPLRRLHEQADLLASTCRAYLQPVTRLQDELRALTHDPAADLARQQVHALDLLYAQSRPVADQFGIAQIHTSIAEQLRGLTSSTVLDQALSIVRGFSIDQQSVVELFANASVRNELQAALGDAKRPLIEDEMERMLAAVRGISGVSIDAISGSLSIGTTEFPIDSFETAIISAAKHADRASVSRRPNAFLSAILAQAKQLKGKKGAALILVLLFWICKSVGEGQIQTISGALLRPVTDKIIRTLKPEVRKRITRVREEAPLVDIRTLRLVTARNLAVRVAPRRNMSRILTLVSAPTIVIVIRCDRDWALVQFRDGDAIVRGWVFARYLAKIAV